MIAVWILGGLAILCLLLIAIAFMIDSETLGVTSFGMFVALTIAALITWGAVTDARHDQYDRETQQICDDKGGILSKKDGLCYVNNKPVEFEPGVWKR
jgi:hypothetical protein